MDVSQIKPEGATPVSAVPAEWEDERLEAITEIARRIGSLSVSIASASGEVTDTSDRVNRQAEVFQEIAAQTEQMASQSRSVLASANNAVEISGKAEEKVVATSGRLTSMVQDVSGLIEAVTRISEQLSSLETALQRVAQVSSEVDNISRKTNLLSLNASIEAARAGRHGRGFMVVAQEVKDLSTLTGEATGEIQETVSTLSGELRGLMSISRNAVKSAGDIRKQTDGIGEEIDALPSTLGEVSAAQRDILAATGDISQASGDVGKAVSALSSDVTDSSENLRSAISMMESITENSEAITAMTAQLGVETVDTPYIEEVQKLAKEFSALMEDAVAQGRISMQDLMSREYELMPGTNPEQHFNPACNFADRYARPILDRTLEFSDAVVFSSLMNRDGFMPTHNSKFSMTPRHGEFEWNKAHCRNRCFYPDRVGMAGGNHTRPFLLQAYRRDMGGEWVMMKDVSSPIYVNGQHWGGVRLAYNI